MMKQNLNKITKSKGFKLSMSILAAVVGIGAVSGLAVGLSMASESGYIEYAPYMKTDSKIDYGHDFNNNETQTSTYWAGTEDVVVGDKIEKKKLDEPTTATDLMKATAWSDPTSTNFNDRYNYTQLVSNGSGNAILDKSFQQAAYFAQTYWVHTADGVFNTNWNFEKPKFDFKFVKDLEISDTNQPDKEEFSSVSQKPAGDGTNDYTSIYRAAHDAGKRNLVCPGYQHATPLAALRTTERNTYDSMSYILIDSEDTDKNVASIQFKAEQSAFLCGIAGCQYLEDSWADVYSKYNDGQLRIGTFGGQNFITVSCFMGGLEMGIWFYNNYILPNTEAYKNADKEEKEKRTVKFISLGKKDSYFTGSFVSGDAKLVSQELLSKGASMIMPVCGPQVGDVVNEIIGQKSPCRVLGVDSAMENGDFGEYKSASDLLPKETRIILCSAEKNIAQLTIQVLNNVWSGNRVVYPQTDLDASKANGEEEATTNFKILNDGENLETLEGEGHSLAERNGAIGTIGYTSIGNLYNNGVNLSEAGQKYLYNALQNVSFEGIAPLEEEYWKNIDSYSLAVQAILGMPIPIIGIDGKQRKDEKGDIIKKSAIEILTENRYFYY